MNKFVEKKFLDDRDPHGSGFIMVSHYKSNDYNNCLIRIGNCSDILSIELDYNNKKGKQRAIKKVKNLVEVLKKLELSLVR